jgi:hypothetical protein
MELEEALPNKGEPLSFQSREGRIWGRGGSAGEVILKFMEKPLNKAGNMPIPFYRSQ